MRYVGEDDTGENITREEADSLHAAGHKIAIVYQVGKAWMLDGGYDRGRLAGRVAMEQAIAAGMPHTRPIYFSLDVNPAVFTAGQWAVVEHCLAGIQYVIPYNQIGVYGARSALDRLIPHHATWGWQTYAWSGYIKELGDSRLQDIWSDWASVRQYLNGQSLCGGTVDFDESMTADFGQW